MALRGRGAAPSPARYRRANRKYNPASRAGNSARFRTAIAFARPKIAVAEPTPSGSSTTPNTSMPDRFSPSAAYSPLAAQGSKAGNMLGFLRGEDVAVIVPRLPLTTNGNWAGTTLSLPPGDWKNAFTGEIVTGGLVKLQTMLDPFPVALLTREEWDG